MCSLKNLKAGLYNYENIITVSLLMGYKVALIFFNSENKLIRNFFKLFSMTVLEEKRLQPLTRICVAVGQV